MGMGRVEKASEVRHMFSDEYAEVQKYFTKIEFSADGLKENT
jgi:hypothetical protein